MSGLWHVFVLRGRPRVTGYACGKISARCLVSQCLFVRTITSERRNVRRSNLAVRYIAQKSRQTLKGQGQRSKV